MKPYIVVPTYNEAGNIEELVRSIAQQAPLAEVVVVDDNSPDGTGVIVDRLKGEVPQLHVIHRAGKLGLGTAYLAGYRYGLKHGADAVVTMDADFSHGPQFLPSILAAAEEGAEVVIGSRYVTGGGTVNFEWYRKVISQGANLCAKTLLGLRPRDCTSGFRCYRRRVLEEIDLDTLISNGYSFLMEILYRCEQRQFTIREVPICYVARVQGLSKISRHEILNAFKTLFRLKAESLRHPAPR